MRLRKGRGCPIEAGLRVGDEFDRDRLHAPFEAALGDEAVGKAGLGEAVLQPVAQTPGQHDGVGAGEVLEPGTGGQLRVSAPEFARDLAAKIVTEDS